jgi:hypothetical protein
MVPMLRIAFAANLAAFFAAGTFLSVLFYPYYRFVSAMIVAAETSPIARFPGIGAPPSARFPLHLLWRPGPIAVSTLSNDGDRVGNGPMTQRDPREYPVLSPARKPRALMCFTP